MLFLVLQFVMCILLYMHAVREISLLYFVQCAHVYIYVFMCAIVCVCVHI